MTCPTAADSACAKSVCLPSSGACQLTAAEYLDISCIDASGGAPGEQVCTAKLAAPGSAAKKVGCDDGDDCSQGDLCDKGVCAAGATNACSCKGDADCAALEDGNACNGKLFCNPQVGQCQLNPASAESCPSVDDSDCVKNACVPKTGACEPTNVELVDVICTTLSNGQQQCRSEQQPAADPKKLGLACDDGDPCTADTVCKGASCQGGTDTCKCSQDADCKAQDDGNLCNGLPYCDKITGTCKPNSALTVVCKTVDNTKCSKLACHPKTGECIATAAQDAKLVCNAEGADCRYEVKAPGEPTPLVGCDDGDACTSNDTCVGGLCQGGKSICECQTDSDCDAKDDGDKCNGTFYCDKSGGKAKCTFNPGSIVVCGQQPSDPCVVKACDPKTGNCGLKAANEGKACDDGDLCTAGDACKAGSCGGAKASCDDNDVCTVDSCKAGVGCVHAKANCDDGNACTLDVCDAKTGACTLDKDALAGKACDADGDPCTAGDACKTGTCAAGAKVVCTLDTGACEAAKCVPASGGFQCVKVAKDDGAPCTDGAGCTVGATCLAGQCAAGSKPRLLHLARGVAGAKTRLQAVAALPKGADDAGGHALAVGAAQVGEVGKPTSSAWWIARFDRAGASLLPAKLGKGAELTLSSPLPDAEVGANAVAVREDGSAVVAGTLRDKVAGLNAQVVALDPQSGAVQWSEQVGSQGKDEAAAAMAVQPGGAVVIAGWQREGSGARTPWVARLTAAGGYVWQAAAFGGEGEITGAAAGAAGLTVLIGATGAGASAKGRLVALAPDGKGAGLDTVLVAPGGLWPAAITPSDDGWIIAGTTWAEGGSSPRATWLRTDAKGKARWQRSSPVHSAATAVMTHGKRWLLAGRTNPSGGDDDAWLSEIDGHGNLQWQRTMDGGSHDALAAVAAGSDGDVLAVGRRDGGGGAADGLLVRSDAFGHTSCAGAGGCLAKAAGDCDDGKACTADDCHASGGCKVTAVDDFACDPKDGCSLDGVCEQGACAPAANGKLFAKTLPQSSSWRFSGLTTLQSGGLATLAAQDPFDGPMPRQVWLARLDDSGALLASDVVYTHNGQGNGNHPVRAYALVERADGGFVAAVGHGSPTGTIYYPRLLGVSASGQVQWTKTAVYSVCSNGEISALRRYPSGDILDVRICPNGYQNRSHSYVLRRNGSGDATWTEGSTGRYFVEGADVLLQDGLVVGKDTAWVVGSIYGGKDASVAHHSAFVAAFDGQGAEAWRRVHGQHDSSGLVAIAATAKGELVAAGWRIHDDVRRALLMGLGAGGKVLWQQAATAGPGTTPTALLPLGDGALLLSGVRSTGVLDKAWIGRYDAVGSLEVERILDIGLSAEASRHGLVGLADGTIALSGAASVQGKAHGLIARMDHWGYAGCKASAGCLLKSQAACTDGDACTTDACSAGACTHDAASCGDGDVCTADACGTGPAAKSCVHGAGGCDDADPCTADVCDKLEGCVHLDIPGCSAADPCKQPVCDVKGCAGTVLAGQCYEAPLSGLGLQSVALKACTDSGRTLFSVHDAATEVMAVDLMRTVMGGKNTAIWTGLYKIDGTSPWTWTDGSPADYSNLPGFEPLSVTEAKYETKAVYISVVSVPSVSGFWSIGNIKTNVYGLPICAGLPKASCVDKPVADGTACGQGKSCKAGDCVGP